MFERLLVFSDTHFPAQHPDTLHFLETVAECYKPTNIICLGDLVDSHASSMHDHNPDLPSPGEELERTIGLLKYLYKLFPDVVYLRGNHCELFERRALKFGLPRRALRDFRDILELPDGWQVQNDLRLTSGFSEIYFTHFRSSAIMSLAQWESCSAIQGHYHHLHQVCYWRNSSGKMLCNAFCGSLVDDRHIAMLYARNNLKRSALGCTMIVAGAFFPIPLETKTNGRWIGVL
jgi:hypothetical protein